MYRIAFSAALMIVPAASGLLDLASPFPSPAQETPRVLPESERATTTRGADAVILASTPVTLPRMVDGVMIVPTIPVEPSFAGLILPEIAPGIDTCRATDLDCFEFIEGEKPGKGTFEAVLADGQVVEISRFRAWREMRCLAYTAWAEARGEGVEGMLAVMLVIRNRRVNDDHEDSICAVVASRGQFESMTRKQAKKWLKAAKNSDLMVPGLSRDMEGPDAAAADSALVLAWRLMTGQIDVDMTEGATFFATVELIEKKGPEVLAQNLVETLVTGNHVFFRQEAPLQVAQR